MILSNGKDSLASMHEIWKLYKTDEKSLYLAQKFKN